MQPTTLCKTVPIADIGWVYEHDRRISCGLHILTPREPGETTFGTNGIMKCSQNGDVELSVDGRSFLISWNGPYERAFVRELRPLARKQDSIIVAFWGGLLLAASFFDVFQKLVGGVSFLLKHVPF